MTPDGAWRDLTFSGRTAVVTGGARGIGRAVAYRLAGLGARTVIWDRDGGAAEQAALDVARALERDGRPAGIEWAVVDVTDLGAVTRCMEAAALGEGLDVLVNNAGTTSVQKFESMPYQAWETALSVNLTGTFHCCQAAIPHLRRRPGAAIVNISSSAALVGGGGGAHYAASKAGVDGLTRHLARELAPGVRVNSVQPRTIDTDLFQRRYANAQGELARLIGQIPLGRAGRPEDVADAVVFLASGWSSYITGQVLLVDGGRTFQ